jgi:hypothetical protein
LGKSVPDVELKRQPTEYEQRLLRQKYWQESFTNALPKGWKVLNIVDGATLQIEGCSTTSVSIICGNDESIVKFILIPKEWEEIHFPKANNLGINGKDNQGGRYFFLEGTLPKNVQDNLVNYFGLEKFQ